MMIPTKATSTPPSIEMKSNTRCPSRVGRLWRSARDGGDDEPGAGRPGDGYNGARWDVDGGSGTEFVGLALGLHEDAAEPAGRDRDRDRRAPADKARGRERIGTLRPFHQVEQEEDDPEA